MNEIHSLDSFFTDGQVRKWPLVKHMVRNVIDDIHTFVPSMSLLPILSHPATCLLALYQSFLNDFHTYTIPKGNLQRHHRLHNSSNDTHEGPPFHGCKHIVKTAQSEAKAKKHPYRSSAATFLDRYA